MSTQTLPGDTLEHRTESVGVVHPHVEIRVVDPATGDTLPRGETGEFCTRGYSVMQGYWDEPGKSAAAIDGDGWMHTGDLAVMAIEDVQAIGVPDEKYGEELMVWVKPNAGATGSPTSRCRVMSGWSTSSR